jgi:ComF family protein
MLAQAARRVTAALFGGSCYLCRGAASEVLCPACQADLPAIDAPCCPRCGLGAPGGALCGRCLAQPPAFDATRAALAYRFPADVLVHALKFRGELALAPFLGALLAARLNSFEPVACIAPVPMSAARLCERGYNQALELAREVARAARVPLEARLLERVRDTPAQIGLPWAARAKNVRGAFRCTRALAGETVAVVDDVMTTGATLEELAATLKRAGAARVVNWVLARTPAPQEP